MYPPFPPVPALSRAIYRRLGEAGIEFPIPQWEVTLRELDGPREGVTGTEQAEAADD